KQNKEDAAIQATLRLRNPRTRSSSLTSSSSSVTAAPSSTVTICMPVAKSSRKRGHSRRSPILLIERQKENVHWAHSPEYTI
ncbi:unnamed protein product, partial [Rotaria sp. Silwood2]